jgi:hypothetical protein
LSYFDGKKSKPYKGCRTKTIKEVFPSDNQGSPKTFALNGYLHQINFETGSFGAEFELRTIDGFAVFERANFSPGIHCILPRGFDRYYFKNTKVQIIVTKGELFNFEIIQVKD